MVKLAEQVVPLKLDGERAGKGLAEKHGVNGFPTILFLRPDGTEFTRMVGYQPPAPFAAQLAELITAEKTSMAVMRRLAAAPEDGPANRSAASLYAILGRRDAAISAFKKAELAGFHGEMLGRAANKIGDMFQNEGELDSAIVWFEVARFYSGGNVDTEEYALISLATCFQMKEQPEKAKAYAQKILDLKGGSGAYRDFARQMLEE